MRKFQKAAVVVAMLGSVGFIGAGTASAGGHGGPDIGVTQSSACTSHDLNVDVLGNVGILNGVAGNLLGGEGDRAPRPPSSARRWTAATTLSERPASRVST
ncbi:hypothetical protein NKH18_41555 [Streptomyces sp. M10(2022)]